MSKELQERLDRLAVVIGLPAETVMTLLVESQLDMLEANDLLSA